MDGSGEVGMRARGFGEGGGKGGSKREAREGRIWRRRQRTY